MNDGFVNEEELMNYINNNWQSLNANIRKFLEFTFEGKYDGKQRTTVEKCHPSKGGNIKPDLKITHNRTVKYISVKKGSGDSVHQEDISEFFPFIQERYGNTILDKLKLYHYGDGTKNDTGKIRYNASQCKDIYSDELSEMNRVFNEWGSLETFLNRFLFVGNVSNLAVDVVYHGTVQGGVWASRKEIMNYFKNHTFQSNALHFGSLTYQVWGRNQNFTAVHPDRRYVMQVKWGSVEKDLANIRSGSI